MTTSKIFIVMGVSGCGKSTVGEILATKLGLPFFDGDDYHPKSNVEKMANGTPLNDDDRAGWLQALNLLSLENQEKGAVIVCSALKKTYRNQLKKGLEHIMRFVYLEGTFELIHKRLKERSGHFMPPGLLKSQFEALEPPANALTVSIENSPETIVDRILEQLGSN